MKHTILAIAILSALTACAGGGGGGNVRNDPPANPPPTNPPTNPPPQTCQDPTARNYGGALPCIPRYRGPKDNLAVPANVDRAHAAGFTGAGIRIGLLDTIPNPNDGSYQPIAGSGKYEYIGSFLPTGSESASKADHGNTMAYIMAGRPTATFDGGVAPDATVVWAEFCSVKGCDGDAPAAYRAFADRGVTIVNHSFNGGRADEVRTDPGFLNWARGKYSEILSRDLLAVWAAGNDVSDQPGMYAGIPIPLPEFRNNWLVATSVNIDAQGKPTTPAASQCGVTAQWCVAVPWELPVWNGTTYIGSSQGTAFLSGVAALVQQAFPWMGGANLQTTLLTTATDLGAPGVDPVYGWGFVNAERAIRGPGQFLGEFKAHVNRTGTWTFANDISGSGGLTKTGVGALKLSGQNTYTGLTDVREGELILSGRIAGDVRNAATFASEGGRIGGSYTAQAGSTTAVQVGKGLTVDGTARLDGTLKLLAPEASYAVKNTERVLTAGQVQGTFANVTYGSGFFYSATLTYGSGFVDANLTRTSAAAAATAMSASAAAVAGGERTDALLDWLDAGNGDAAVRMAAGRLMSAADAAQAVASLESLAGEVQGTVRLLGIEQALGDAAVVADRALDSRTAQADSAVWVEAVGRRGTLEQGDYADADLSVSGVVFGADRKVGETARIGVALSASELRGDLDAQAGEFDGDRRGVALYGQAEVGAGYVTGVLGHDRLDARTERTVLLGSSAERVTGEREDRVQHGRLEAGWTGMDGFTPYVAAGAIRYRQGAFREAGAAGLGLAAAQDTHTASYAEAGFRVDYRLAHGGQVAGALALRDWVSGRDPAFAATFAGAPVAFMASGQTLPSETLRLSLRYLSPIKHGWQWWLEGAGEATNASVRDARLGFGVRYGF